MKTNLSFNEDGITKGILLTDLIPSTVYDSLDWKKDVLEITLEGEAKDDFERLYISCWGYNGHDAFEGILTDSIRSGEHFNKTAQIPLTSKLSPQNDYYVNFHYPHENNSKEKPRNIKKCIITIKIVQNGFLLKKTGWDGGEHYICCGDIDPLPQNNDNPNLQTMGSNNYANMELSFSSPKEIYHLAICLELATGEWSRFRDYKIEYVAEGQNNFAFTIPLILTSGANRSELLQNCRLRINYYQKEMSNNQLINPQDEYISLSDFNLKLSVTEKPVNKFLEYNSSTKTLQIFNESAFFTPYSDDPIPEYERFLKYHNLASAEINSISFSEGITYIPDWEFSGFTTLTSISLPSTIKYIGINSFNFIQFSVVNIPPSIKVLKQGAFYQADRIILGWTNKDTTKRTLEFNGYHHDITYSDGTPYQQ